MPHACVDRLARLTRVMMGKADRDRGATAVEYTILVAMIAAVIITAVIYFGTQASSLFVPVSDFFQTHH
jgi:Flp pilus assembly pilin Flp